MEQLATPAAVMRKRVEETLDLLGIADAAPPAAAHPLGRPAAARRHRRGADRAPAVPRARRADVRAGPDRRRGRAGRRHPARARPRHHRRRGRAPPRAGRAVRRPACCCSATAPGRHGRPGDRDARLRRSHRRSCELGRLAGWDPLPLSVRDARRPRPVARPGRGRRLGDRVAHGAPRRGRRRAASRRGRRGPLRRRCSRSARSTSTVAPGEVVAADGPQRLRQVVAAVGAAGVGPRRRRGAVDGRRVGPTRDAPARGAPAGRAGAADAADLLYLRPVDAECAQADDERGRRRRDRRALLGPAGAAAIAARRHPRDLSEGQRLALVLAVQLARDPGVVLLDEPTRGLDYAGEGGGWRRDPRGWPPTGRRSCSPPTTWSSSPTSADRVVVLAEGEVVADGPTRRGPGRVPAAVRAAGGQGARSAAVADRRRGRARARPGAAPGDGSWPS